MDTMTIYNDKDIAKSTSKLEIVQLYQIGIVKDGWGWLYAEGDTKFSETINKHIDILCDCFNMQLVPTEDAIVSVAVYETDESFTFEGTAESISLYKRYEEGCPTVQDDLTVKRVTSLLKELWSNYHGAEND